MPTCWHCKVETPAEHYDRIVYNRLELHGPWAGWRLAGSELVSPDGMRITLERIRGLLTRCELERRRYQARIRAASASRSRQQLVKVVIVDLQDYRYRGFAAA